MLFSRRIVVGNRDESSRKPSNVLAFLLPSRRDEFFLERYIEGQRGEINLVCFITYCETCVDILYIYIYTLAIARSDNCTRGAACTCLTCNIETGERLKLRDCLDHRFLGYYTTARWIGRWQITESRQVCLRIKTKRNY